MADLGKHPQLLKLLAQGKVLFAANRPVEVNGRLYDPRAIAFLMLGMKKALLIYRKVGPDAPEESRHLTGGELLEGLRRLGLAMFGPLAQTVFAHWGVHRTEDWGEMVFFLVDSGVLKKTERDSRRDFAAGYDFAVAFRPRRYWKHVTLAPITLANWGADSAAAPGAEGPA